MERNRFYDVRASLLPEAIGNCATNIPDLARMVNEAQQRLMMDPQTPDEGWWGGWARFAFNVAAPYQFIYTPQEVARIIVMDVCKHPMRLKNQWYEFMEYGPGYQPKGCRTGVCQTFQAYERETVPTLSPLTDSKTIRFYPDDAGDIGKRMLVQGTDINGKTVLGTNTFTGQTVLGESVPLDIPFADTVNIFSTITGLQKDVTKGFITAVQVDPTTGDETPLTVLEPYEMTTQYRKYFLNGLNRTCCGQTPIQLLAMCRLDFIPVVVDSDYLMIQNVPALIEECMAVRYSRMDLPGSVQLAQARHANALRLLNGQLDMLLGKESTAINRSIFGGNPLRLQPM